MRSAGRAHPAAISTVEDMIPRRDHTRPARAAASPYSLGIDRRTAWPALLGLILLLTLAMGLFRTAQIPARGDAIPADAESARVAAELKSRPGSDIATALLVATRADNSPLDEHDLTALTTLTRQVTPSGMPPAGPAKPSVSPDRRAAITTVPLRVTASNSESVAPVTALRAAVAEHAPAGLRIELTGGPVFGADIAGAFSGADLRLLLVTVGIVAVLLLLTYRSPTLWLIPLTVVALADQLAGVVAKAVGQASGLTFDAGIVSVLVFGAGTNYALLLISRYREELRRHEDHREALTVARRAVVPAILASNLTVVLALATLLLAVVPGTRGLGLAGAVGLLIAALAVLVSLPAALSLLGRRVFWPFVPRPGQESQEERSAWSRLGHAVTGRPVAVVAGALVLLGVLATGLVGTTVGLTQAEQFRVESPSQRGLSVISQHFPGGTAAPLTVLVDEAHTDEVKEAVSRLPQIATVRRSGPAVEGRAVLTVIGDAVPGSEDARRSVTAVREVAAAHPQAHVMVGGSTAVQVDAGAAAQRDVRVIAPLVLGLTALVLMVLLRAVLLPLVLLAVNTLSAFATIGAGAWLGRHVFGFPALDVQVPLIAFLFLVALGVDYTIFLVHRADQEARLVGVREGMARAVGSTGAVITSAGVVLAGVFAALGVLPLVVLGQLGLIVGLGVVVDTFVVRALLVPGVVVLLGCRGRDRKPVTA